MRSCGTIDSRAGFRRITGNVTDASGIERRPKVAAADQPFDPFHVDRGGGQR